MRRHSLIDSPLGLIVALDDDGRLVRLGVLDPREGEPGNGSGEPSGWGERDDAAQPALREQLDAYWQGGLQAFDLPLAPVGTPFQQRVWAALRTIPYGQTASYRQIAEQIGQPTAVRAVGAANGRNPIWLVVPCHRVVGSDGALTGYAGGIELKRRLLDHERASLWTCA
jgi:methylated-DNA-[protein]-cysteine S-methyltransferase